MAEPPMPVTVMLPFTWVPSLFRAIVNVGGDPAELSVKVPSTLVGTPWTVEAPTRKPKGKPTLALKLLPLTLPSIEPSSTAAIRQEGSLRDLHPKVD